MKSINHDNMDEIMFMLLEGEIQGAERIRLLEAIEADPEYSKTWAIWQNTKITPDESLVMPVAHLKKEKKGFIVPFQIVKYAAAAVIVLAIGSAMYFNSQTDIEVAGNGKGPSKPSPSIEAPKPSQVKTIPVERTKDSGKSALREKIRFMAEVPELPRLVVPESPNKFENIDTIIAPFKQSPENVLAHYEVPQIDPETFKNNNDVLVTISNSDQTIQKNNQTKRNLLERVFGNVKVKIENDSNTITKRKMVIENEKYQIIAGF